MSKTLRSIIAGMAATPIVLIFTIGIGLVSGLNPHSLIISVLITNIIGLILHRDSPYIFNLSQVIIVILFVFNREFRLESGFLQSFIIFTIPALIFSFVSFLSIKIPLMPKIAIGGITLGIGSFIFLKEIPNAFAYYTIQGDFTFGGEEESIFKRGSVSNWIQLGLALSVPIIALIGRRFGKGNLALLLATIFIFGLGYLFGYDTSLLKFNSLSSYITFEFNWEFSPELVINSISTGITIGIVMLLHFWSVFSMLDHDQLESKASLKKNMRIIGIGNFLSAPFGVFPAGLAIVDSLSLREFGAVNWTGKLPIIISLFIIAFVGIPDLYIPQFVFAGVMFYLGIVLILKSWTILKGRHWIEYLMTLLVACVFLFTDFIMGFAAAMIYLLIYNLIKKVLDRKGKTEAPNN